MPGSDFQVEKKNVAPICLKRAKERGLKIGRRLHPIPKGEKKKGRIAFFPATKIKEKEKRIGKKPATCRRVFQSRGRRQVGGELSLEVRGKKNESYSSLFGKGERRGQISEISRGSRNKRGKEGEKED